MLCASVNDEALCDFFEAGPLLTPGFRPVWVFGELEPLLLLPHDEDEDDGRGCGVAVDTVARLAPAIRDIWLDELDPWDGDERVLLIVSLIPSDDGFTMYSLLVLLEGETAVDEEFTIEGDVELDGAEPGLEAEGDDLGICAADGDSSPTCWADFSLSMTALNEPLRFFAAA